MSEEKIGFDRQIEAFVKNPEQLKTYINGLIEVTEQWQRIAQARADNTLKFEADAAALRAKNAELETRVRELEELYLNKDSFVDSMVECWNANGWTEERISIEMGELAFDWLKGTFETNLEEALTPPPAEHAKEEKSANDL